VRYLRQERPAAVLAGLHHANVVALLARRLSGVTTRVVVTVHDAMSYGATYSPNLRQRLIPYLIGRFYPGADAVVAVSRGVADDLARTTGVARERITVIYNPVVTPDVARRADAPPDPARFRDWYAAGRAPVILSVGRLAPEKDFSTLIRAFAGLSDNLPARLLILGEGPERAQLEALIDALALGERVALPGFVANPFAHMARAGVFVLSSTFEGLPSALIQAMACGCPVVATDCPHGPAEILAGGRHGRLVPIGDVAAMTKAVADALTAPRNAEALRAGTAPFAAGPSTERYLEVLGLAGSGG